MSEQSSPRIEPERPYLREHRDLEDLPVSARFVYFVLRLYGPMTPDELQDHTVLSSGSIRTAMQKLDDLGLVSKSLVPGDGRKRVYELVKEAPE